MILQVVLALDIDGVTVSSPRELYSIIRSNSDCSDELARCFGIALVLLVCVERLKVTNSFNIGEISKILDEYYLNFDNPSCDNSFRMGIERAFDHIRQAHGDRSQSIELIASELS